MEMQTFKELLTIICFGRKLTVLKQIAHTIKFSFKILYKKRSGIARSFLMPIKILLVTTKLSLSLLDKVAIHAKKYINRYFNI